MATKSKSTASKPAAKSESKPAEKRDSKPEIMDSEHTQPDYLPQTGHWVRITAGEDQGRFGALESVDEKNAVVKIHPNGPLVTVPYKDLVSDNPYFPEQTTHTEIPTEA